MDTINLLIDTQNETEKFFGLSETDLLKKYGVGKWTIKQILVHLSDAESVLLERIKRVIAEPKQVIWAFDQDLWCQNLDYQNYPLPLAKSIYLANRETTIYLYSQYYKALGHKEFIHSETGTRTLKDEFDKVGVHNQLHLEQIKKALIVQ